MTRSLVISLILSIAAGTAAATVSIYAGFGWLAALALYSGVGSTSLVAFALIAAEAKAPATAKRKARPVQESPAYA